MEREFKIFFKALLMNWNMREFLSSFLLPLLIVSAFMALAFTTYQKYQRISLQNELSLEQVLFITKNKKNIPIIEELFRLGVQVRDIKDQKTSKVEDEEQRKVLILLSRMCKDTCKTIRCRIDPGLGHACRINCPDRRVKLCKLATPELISP